MKNKHTHRSLTAFSLLEIVVATAILALIVVVLAALSSHATRIWTATDAQNQRRATGRTLIQFIARDLEMATLAGSYPASGNNAANLQFVASDPTLIPAELLNPHAAFWQAPIAADRTRGDIAEIGYFVRWDTVSEPGTAKAQLCRFLVDPSDTKNYLIYSNQTNGNPASWLQTSILDQVAPATAAEDYRGWFADNVIAFWFRCLDSQGRPILKTASGHALNGGYGFDSGQGYENPTTGRKHAAPALPASVEIALVTVDSRTARRISAPLPAFPNSPENFSKDQSTAGSVAFYVANLPEEIKPGVQVFSTRIFLRNSGN